MGDRWALAQVYSCHKSSVMTQRTCRRVKKDQPRRTQAAGRRRGGGGSDIRVKL